MAEARKDIILPAPPSPESEPVECPLSELVPKTYATVKVRILRMRGKEKTDELGQRPYIYGTAEDNTFRVPFISYKTFIQLERDSVFRFENAYVHEFEDSSLLLILTEFSKIRFMPEENPEEYSWIPRIASITRPLAQSYVTLKGMIIRVYDSSGLVRRCNECNRIVIDESCPQHHQAGNFPAVRISAKLNDSTGSINTVFSSNLACRLLDRPISEILCCVETGGTLDSESFDEEVFALDMPQEISMVEATVLDDPLSFRSNSEPIVPDRQNPKIYYPLGATVANGAIQEEKTRILKHADENDRRLIRQVIQKVLEVQLSRSAELPRLHGIQLLEEPTQLFCEKAKLFLGVETRVTASPERTTIEAHPRALVRESILDYIRWRRLRGASPRAIENSLTRYKSNVVLAPNGSQGIIVGISYKEAGEFTIPITNQPLPEFWKHTHGIDVKPEEKPLILVKPEGLDVTLTYPPSCVYLDESSLWMRSGVKHFIESKRQALRGKAFNKVLSVLQDFKIGDQAIHLTKVLGHARPDNLTLRKDAV